MMQSPLRTQTPWAARHREQAKPRTGRRGAYARSSVHERGAGTKDSGPSRSYLHARTAARAGSDKALPAPASSAAPSLVNLHRVAAERRELAYKAELRRGVHSEPVERKQPAAGRRRLTARGSPHTCTSLAGIPSKARVHAEPGERADSARHGGAAPAAGAQRRTSLRVRQQLDLVDDCAVDDLGHLTRAQASTSMDVLRVRCFALALSPAPRPSRPCRPRACGPWARSPPDP
jgi:hypothetical protein